MPTVFTPAQRQAYEKDGFVLIPSLFDAGPWRDGTTHLRMTPLEFMQRLAALVPRARLHLIRFHGVLAPNASLRGALVPGPAQDTRVPSGEHAQGAPARMGWARLLKRVFDLDLEHCPQSTYKSGKAVQTNGATSESVW